MEKYLSCEQIAERYGVKVATVQKWVREKELPALEIGKGYRISTEDLKEFENSRKTS